MRSHTEGVDSLAEVCRCHLNNVKGLCLIFVCWHHIVSFVRRVCGRKYSEEFFWLLGNPSFTMCFISGMFAQSKPKLQNIKKNAVRLLFPQLLWVLLSHVLVPPADGPLIALYRKYTTCSPQWYFVALFYWRLCGSALVLVPFATRLFVALMLCTCGPMRGCIMFLFSHLNLGPLEVCNTCVWFPIFILGQCVGQVSPSAYLQPTSHFGILCKSCSVGLLFAIHLNQSCTGFTSYELRSMGRYLLWMSLLFSMCPKQECFLSRIGKHSIYPAMLERHVCYCAYFALNWMHLPHSFCYPSNAYLEDMLPPCLAVALCAVLATWPVRMLFRVLLEPMWLESRCVRISENTN